MSIRHIACVISLIIGQGLAVEDSQTAQPAPRPTFEVVSVKHSGGLVPGRVPRPIRFRGGRIMCDDTLARIIRAAYHLEDWEYSAPFWLETEYYEVQAIAPAGTSDAAKDLMLQTMLERRFALKCHREEKQLPIYALTIGKGGLKLPAGVVNELGESRRMSAGVFRSGSSTLGELASFLTNTMDRPVFDLTGTTSKYQVNIDWSGALHRPHGDEPRKEGGMIFSRPPVVEPGEVAGTLGRLGLQLESRKRAVSLVVVDSVRREPTPN
jgi:uncharacterized protein (TIGR03435 family)